MYADSILVLVAASSLLGCSSPSTPAPPTGAAPSAAEVTACATAETTDRPAFASYWSPGTFDDPTDEFVRHWYSAQLCAMGEAPLAAPSQRGTRVRFLWLRSFHPGIAVRIEHGAQGTKLTAIELDGAGGYAPGAVARRVDRPLSPGEWAALRQALAESGFWNLQTSERILGLDGAEWIVEVAEHDRYHVVDRWSGGAVEPIGRLLLELSRLEPDPIY
jgi:hypothetical protein